MDQTLLSQVEAIATNVRYWAEGRDEEGNGDLNGWCARASAQLLKQLKEEGIASEIHVTVTDEGLAHAYLVVEDHVVDVTATQFREFRRNPVVIIHQREAEEHWFYEGNHVFQSGDELRKWQKKSRWPAIQIAYA